MGSECRLKWAQLLKLENIQSLEYGPKILFFVEVSGFRALNRRELTELGQLLQGELRDVPVQLMVGQEKVVLTDARGRFRTEFSSRRAPTAEEEITWDEIHDVAEAWLRKHEYTLEAWSVVLLEDKYHALFEVKGPRLMSLDAVKSLEDDITSRLKIPLEISVRSMPEVVITKQGYTTFEELLDTFGERTRRAYDKETRELLETWR